MAAFALAFAPAEISDPGGITGAVRAVFMAAFVAVAVGVLQKAREADRYLDRSFPPA